MEEMIRRIMDIDRMAREMTARAEEMKNKARAEIPHKKEKLRAELLQKAEDRIRRLEAEERRFAEESLREKERECEAALQKMREAFEANSDRWVRETVRRVLED